MLVEKIETGAGSLPCLQLANRPKHRFWLRQQPNALARQSHLLYFASTKVIRSKRIRTRTLTDSCPKTS